MTAVIHPGYPFNGSGLPRLDGVSWVENVFELLGAPGSSGQFYVDSSYVYYVPRAGEDMSTATAELALAESLVELRGTPAHVAPLNDDDPAIMYSPGWQKLTNRAVGDLRDDVHGTQSATDAMSYTFVGTGIDVLGETSTDGGEVDVTVTQAGRPIDAKTITTLGTARFAQQAIYSIAKLPKDTYTITIKKHAADASWLAIDALVTTSEPLTTVHDIVFSGLTFAYAAWSVPSKSGYVDNQAGVLWDPASGAPARVPGAVTVHRGERLDFSRNTFHHLGGAGLELADGTRNTTVVGNRFDDISAGGILVERRPAVGPGAYDVRDQRRQQRRHQHGPRIPRHGRHLGGQRAKHRRIAQPHCAYFVHGLVDGLGLGMGRPLRQAARFEHDGLPARHELQRRQPHRRQPHL